ncbi:hypothetical protein EUGRSUZ_L02712 [Eucalyptus grandis]|uniref:Uncharacterized protein n=1 Tax=Eucalyptus grandis TaxID=71139 RepID=A0AAD9T8W7_EUCGR|nr:hypothetical protein EUGRSUZ_L02712 [Eucalyptus grandis]
MALARLALKNVQQKLGSASSAPSLCRAGQIRQGWNGGEETMAMSRRFLATATEKASDDKEVAVSEKGDGRKFRLFPRRNRRRSLWRRNEDADFVPALYVFSLRAQQRTDASNGEHYKAVREHEVSFGSGV